MLELENPALDQVIAGFEYSYAIKPLLHQLKYQSVRGIGRYLGDLLYCTTPLPPLDLIAAIPLHPKRQADRGFNQAQEIARQLSAHLGVAYIPLTRRLRASVSQASIRSRQQRLKNLEGMFGLVKSAPPLTGKTVLLVDDVCTTGTTLNECAKILKAAGANKVIGLVVAHGN